jgi:hypothetical protein
MPQNASSIVMDDMHAVWQRTNMESLAKRQWYRGGDLEISVNLVETDWGWGTYSTHPPLPSAPPREPVACPAPGRLLPLSRDSD